MIHRIVLAGAMVGLGLALAGCSDREGGVTGKVRVTATVGMVADLARRVGGEHVQVRALMGPGVDPHLYKPTEGDLSRLEEADVILYNGLNLEGKMGDIFVKMASAGKITVPVADAVDKSLLREPPEFQGHYDPHVWFDVSMWAQTIPAVVDALSRAAPTHAEEFERNGEAYRAELMELHEYCRTELAKIPRERRVLVTAHDAFGYFGRAYDVEVVGLQGISTVTEASLDTVAKLAEMLTRRKIGAVFVESSVPRRNIEAVVAGCRARGHHVRIGGQLYSDAMGEEGTPEGTYPGMVRKNVETIVGALK